MSKKIDWQKRLPEIRLRSVAIEVGGTRECAEATNTIVRLLAGFTARLGVSCLTNATALVLCEITDGEVAAVEETRRVRQEIERCITVNYEMSRQRGKDKP